eukprot:767713-Hanusia_phi.AAC.2
MTVSGRPSRLLNDLSRRIMRGRRLRGRRTVVSRSCSCLLLMLLALRLEREALEYSPRQEAQVRCERERRERLRTWQRLFNEQEVKRMHGEFARPVERKYKEHLRCPECHVGTLAVTNPALALALALAPTPACW